MHVYNSLEKLPTILYRFLYPIRPSILQAPKIWDARSEGTLWVF